MGDAERLLTEEERMEQLKRLVQLTLKCISVKNTHLKTDETYQPPQAGGVDEGETGGEERERAKGGSRKRKAEEETGSRTAAC